MLKAFFWEDCFSYKYLLQRRKQKIQHLELMTITGGPFQLMLIYYNKTFTEKFYYIV